MLRRWGASVTAAGLGGAVYGFSPALVNSGFGHYHLVFAVLPPLIIDALLRLVTGRGRAVRTGAWLGLLTAAQLFTGEELLVSTALAGLVLVVVLAAGRPRTALHQLRPAAIGLGTGLAVMLLLCGHALWVQFEGPLREHSRLLNSWSGNLAFFVTPSGRLLFHTPASAAFADGFHLGLSEELAYLGWPLLIVLLAASVRFWRDPRVRAAAVTCLVLELCNLGGGSETIDGVRVTGYFFPWHWLQWIPGLAQVLPDRFCILGAGAAAAVLAFSLDLTRAQASQARHRRAGPLPTLVAVLAILPLIPVPYQAAPLPPVPAGWQAAFARLRLADNATVLVVPVPLLGQTQAMRWQADTGVPGSLNLGYLLGPGHGGQAVFTPSPAKPAAKYLNALWEGRTRARGPSAAQLRADLAYLRPQAVVADTSLSSPAGKRAGQPVRQAQLPGRQPARVAPLDPEQLGEVQRGPASELAGLGAAGKPVGEQQRALGRGPQRRQQRVLGHGHRDVVVPALHAEVARQAAAPGDGIDVRARRPEHGQVGVVAHDRVLVTVRLGENPLPGEPPVQPGQVLRRVVRAEQRLGQGPGGRGHGLGPGVVQELGEVTAEHGGAGRLESDDRHPPLGVFGQVGDHGAEPDPRPVELAGGDPGQAAAGGPAGHDHVEARLGQHGDGRFAQLRRERPGEGVGPDDHTLPRLARGRDAGRQLAQPRGGGRMRVKRRKRPPGIDAAEPPYGPGHGLHPQRGAGQAGSHGGHPGPAREPAEHVVAPGPRPAVVGLVQHLGLVGRHVHRHRAVTGAGLTGQAQVERVVDLGRVPSGPDQRAVRHLLEHPGPAPGRVLLVPGGEERRAHEAAGWTVVGPALAHPDAPVHGLGQVPAVGGEREAADGPQRPGLRQPQVGVGRAGDRR